MKDSLISRIGDLFFEFEAKLQSYERNFLKEHEIIDVTPNEVKVLYLIGLSNNKSMKEIADQLKITQGTLSITVNSLVKKGYVLRTRHKLDKRVIILYLTKKSIHVIKVYDHLYYQIISKLFHKFEPEKIQILESILKELNNGLEYSLDESEESEQDDE
jgi:DNA-binding MarR family transcriptional regulator